LNSLERVAGELANARRVIVSGHVMPDGDCIGSMLALGLALERAGKDVTFVSPGQIPLIYAFLPGVEHVKVNPALPQLNPEAATGLVVIVDTSVPERLGDFLGVVSQLRQSGWRTLLIDHHISALPYADYNYIDPGASAVGEIIFDLLKLLGQKLDRDIATCLYTTIATDTGGFRYETTTSATHRKVAELIEAGVDVRAVSLQIFEERPLKSIEALRAALNTLQISPCGRAAWFTMDKETADRLQIGDEHIDGLVNYARVIQGVEIALLFREVNEGKTKVSFRSKNFVDVSRLAGTFGGGGHPRAAGALVPGKLDAVRDAVINASMTALGS